MKRRKWMLLGVVGAVGCGGEIDGVSDGGMRADAPQDGVAVDGGGITPCSAPGNLKLCGGECGQTCPKELCVGQAGKPDASNELGVCSIPGGHLTVGCSHCEDGHVCILASEAFKQPLPEGFLTYGCASAEYAKMYALNGRLDLSLYADRATYTDAPLPLPDTCASFPGLRLCGGTCGGCNPDEMCMGRSPLHPYSLCVKAPVPTASAQCKRGEPGGISTGIKYRCLTFKVDDAAQPTADRWSVLAREEQCLAAAQYYPGGAFCGP